jgi:hypothetical protein
LNLLIRNKNKTLNINTRIAKVNDVYTGPIMWIGWNRTTGRIYWGNDENDQDIRSIIAGNFRLDGTTLYIDL